MLPETSDDRLVVKGYHFSHPEFIRGGIPLPAAGQTLTWDGDVVDLHNGFHASADPFDALYYAQGPIMHRVSVWEDLVFAQDMFVGRNRMIHKSVDANEMLRDFARHCAHSVIMFWDYPPETVDFLTCSREESRDRDLAAQAHDSTAMTLKAWHTPVVENFAVQSTKASVAENPVFSARKACELAMWAMYAAAKEGLVPETRPVIHKNMLIKELQTLVDKELDIG